MVCFLHLFVQKEPRCRVTTIDLYIYGIPSCKTTPHLSGIAISGSNATHRRLCTNKCKKQNNIELQRVAMPPHYIGMTHYRRSILRMLSFVYFSEPVSRCVALLPVIAMPNKCIVFSPDGIREVYKSVVVTPHVGSPAQISERNKAVLGSND